MGLRVNSEIGIYIVALLSHIQKRILCNVNA